jgi:hypothetical protein
MANLLYSTATIAKSGSLSGAVDMGNFRYFSIQMPAAWTAAGLTFQGSLDGTTYQNIYDDSGSEVYIPTVSASTNVSCDSIALKLIPYRYIKIRSGTAASAVNQEAARTIYLLGKD